MSTQSSDIAMTILKQLGGGKFKAMTGAYNFLAHDSALSLCFKGCKKVNYMKVTLNGLDLYDLEFGRICKKGGIPGYSKVKDLSNLYANDLQRVFTDVTGLDTHL